jgi:intracellular sulfur oxidation DsrE/DsrF family protein
MVAALAIMGYAVWNFQKKTAAREAAAQQRFAELMRGQGSAGGQPTSAPAPTAAASASVPVSHAVPAAPAAASAASAAAVTARERFLGQHETLLYLLLKTGLPDHEIFANVSLAAIVALPASGGEREQQLRRLAPYQLDFVVCDKSMRVIAAVDFEAAGGADAAGIQQFKADYLKRAGIRLVRVNPAAMPKRDQVRALVIGNAAPAAT